MRQTIAEHLEELRKRLIRILIVIALFFFVGFALSSRIINLLSYELVKNLDVSLIVTTPFEFLLTQIFVGLIIAVIMALPLIIYEAVYFTNPALKKKERKILGFILPFTLIFFAAGLLFGYFVFLKAGLSLLSNIALSAGMLNLWSVQGFIRFIITILFFLGLLFQLPLLILLLNKIGAVSRDSLCSARKYFIVAAFFFAALLTPPDPLTMILLGLPLIVLYELGILLTRIF